MTMRRNVDPRERAARALCRRDGHPENIKFEGKPMWQSYLDTVDLVAAEMNGSVEPTDERALQSAARMLMKWFDGSGSGISARWERIPPEERSAIVKAFRAANGKDGAR